MKLEVNSKLDLCPKANFHVLWIHGLWNMRKFQGVWSTEILGGYFSKARRGITWSLKVNKDTAVFCQKPAVWGLFSLYATLIEICVLWLMSGSFCYCRQWTHLTWCLSLLRQVVNPSQKKKKVNLQPSVYCTLYLKIFRGLRLFLINNKKGNKGIYKTLQHLF